MKLLISSSGMYATLVRNRIGNAIQQIPVMSMARTLCEQVKMGEGCYEKVSRSCFNSFGIEGDKRPLEFNIYLIHVSFESLEEQSKREGFQSIPTKLELPQTDIDRLIEIAPELLREDPEFNHLLEDLDARIVG